MRSWYANVWIFCILSSGTALAQAGGWASFNVDPVLGVAHFDGPLRWMPPPILHAPYSGDEVGQMSGTLPNGVQFSRAFPGRRVYRDSLGRTRVESMLSIVDVTKEGQSVGVQVVDIIDCVAGFRYALDTSKRVAHRQKLPVPVPRLKTVAGSSDPQGRKPLGVQSIDGETAEGSRFTYTAGGPDKSAAITSTTETWMLTDLNAPIMTTVIDPVHGTSVHRLTNLKRTEPDPQLFRVPAEYTIVDEAGAFTISAQ